MHSLFKQPGRISLLLLNEMSVPINIEQHLLKLKKELYEYESLIAEEALLYKTPRCETRQKLKEWAMKVYTGRIALYPYPQDCLILLMDGNVWWHEMKHLFRKAKNDKCDKRHQMQTLSISILTTMQNLIPLLTDGNGKWKKLNFILPSSN